MDTRTTTEAVASTASTSTTTDDIVSRAVKFLQHEKVRGAPLDAKRRFLESKSLTAAQIQEALNRASPQAAAEQQPASSSAAGIAENNPPPPPPSRLKWLLLGGAVGGLAGACATLLLKRDPAAAAADESESKVATTPIAFTHEAMVLSPAAATDAADSKTTDSALAALRRLRDEQPSTSTAAGSSSSSTATSASPEETLATLQRSLDVFAASNAADADALPYALQTLLVLLSSQLQHPTEARYQRLNSQNANYKKLIALPGAREVLRSLGFAEVGESSNWPWGNGALPTEADLELIGRCREVLSQRIAMAAST